MMLEEALEKIRSMEVRGAGRIARFAASTVKDFTANSTMESVEELENELMDVFRKLDSTRPSAVSLRNSLRIIHSNSILQFPDAEPEVQELKMKIIEACDDFIQASIGATEKIGKFGSEKVLDGFTVQTHCNSQNALEIIKHSFKQGKQLQVYATESRPWMQGHITVKELAAEKIPVTLIVDSAVRYHMDGVNIVLVGADTITAEGNLINKIGTAQIALAAAELGVPFYTCAETYKFSPESLYGQDYSVTIEERDLDEVLPNHTEFPGVEIANPVFDITSAKHITGIITEKGIIKPRQVEEMIKNEFGSADELILLK